MPSAMNLPRGGVYVKTPAGPVQFGAPAETIKDSMALGLDVARTLVVPRRLFDRRRGINVAEVEFPAYYNFFILKRRLRLVVDDTSVENRIRAVFQESLFGPKGPGRDEEYAPGWPADRRADHLRETESFRRMSDGRRIDVDTLVEFARFDESDVLKLEDGLEIVRHGSETESGRSPMSLRAPRASRPGAGWVVRHQGAEVARIEDDLALPERTTSSRGARETFDPPAFGVTVLGASHGFDPAGKTTGFVLWLGGRGLLVDPPVDATATLRDQGVPPKLIEGVILTHCHADHDSGAFQKVLEEGKVDFFTTPTILGSFLRKYSALSGVSEDILRRTFTFHPVRIGEPVTLGGAEIWFHYALHSIPTVGFEVYCGGKSLFFSADTLYDPERVQALADKGVLGAGRAEDLLGFPGHHTVVLHEAGVPPLHTPIAALAALPDDVKRRLYLVHIAEKDVPTDTGLRSAHVGLSNTIRIDVELSPHAEALELLDVFCSVDLFRDFPLSRAREILRLAYLVTHPRGAKIIQQGTRGDRFYIIASGAVSIVQDEQPIKTYGVGDYFGETAILLDQLRNADVIARTDVTLVELDRHGFLYLLRGTDIPSRLVRLARARTDRTWRLFDRNAALRALTSSQKTELQSYLDSFEVVANETLWTRGEPAQYAVVLDDARVVLDDGTETEPFGQGAFLGDVDALRQGTTHETTARVTGAGKLFRIERAELTRFFANNPGVLVSFLGSSFVE